VGGEGINALITCAIVAIIAISLSVLRSRLSGAGLKDGNAESAHERYCEWIVDQTTQPEGVRFSNETVEVDGHRYVNCEFHNVVLHYCGRRPFHLEGCRFSGKTRLETEPSDIQDVADYLAQYAFMRDDAR
jgi:hypothetical protein